MQAFHQRMITGHERELQEGGLPVTSWKGRVLISLPDAATPMMIDWPQPL